MDDSHSPSASTALGPARSSADHTLTPVNSHPTNTGPIAKKPSLDVEANHHEQTALEHVGATADLAMGSPRRTKVERRLKIKLDLRMSILVSPEELCHETALIESEGVSIATSRLIASQS